MTNTYKVSKRTWKRWTPVARAVFNQTYMLLRGDWVTLAPMSMQKVTPSARDVFSWNAAWIAADAAFEANPALTVGVGWLADDDL